MNVFSRVTHLNRTWKLRTRILSGVVVFTFLSPLMEVGTNARGTTTITHDGPTPDVGNGVGPIKHSGGGPGAGGSTGATGGGGPIPLRGCPSGPCPP